MNDRRAQIIALADEVRHEVEHDLEGALAKLADMVELLSDPEANTLWDDGGGAASAAALPRAETLEEYVDAMRSLSPDLAPQTVRTTVDRIVRVVRGSGER